MHRFSALDRKILQILSETARVSIKEIADKCGVSRTAVNQRLLRLQSDGVIEGSTILIDPKTIGYTTCAYVGIQLERGVMYKSVAARLIDIPEVVECHCTTGPYSMLVKIYVRDNQDLMRILNGTIQEIPGVVTTETLISLEKGFSRSLPIPDAL